jgi:hypothetical protein
MHAGTIGAIIHPQALAARPYRERTTPADG